LPPRREALSVEVLQELVCREFDLLVPPLRGTVVAVLAPVDQPLRVPDRVLFHRVGGHARILTDALQRLFGDGGVEVRLADSGAYTVRHWRN
jgi:hypothetical protein